MDSEEIPPDRKEDLRALGNALGAACAPYVMKHGAPFALDAFAGGMIAALCYCPPELRMKAAQAICDLVISSVKETLG